MYYFVKVELNYRSNVWYDVYSKDGANQMTASFITQQAGQSEKMVEAWLSSEEHQTIYQDNR